MCDISVRRRVRYLWSTFALTCQSTFTTSIVSVCQCQKSGRFWPVSDFLENSRRDRRVVQQNPGGGRVWWVKRDLRNEWPIKSRADSNADGRTTYFVILGMAQSYFKTFFIIIITESRPVRDPSYVIHQRSHYSSPNAPSHHLCRRTLILSKSVCNIMLHQFNAPERHLGATKTPELQLP